MLYLASTRSPPVSSFPAPTCYLTSFFLALALAFQPKKIKSMGLASEKVIEYKHMMTIVNDYKSESLENEW